MAHMAGAQFAALAQIAYDDDYDEMIRNTIMCIPMEKLWNIIPIDKMINFVTNGIRQIFGPIRQIIAIILEKAFKLSAHTANKMAATVEKAITGFISGVLTGLMKVM